MRPGIFAVGGGGRPVRWVGVPCGVTFRLGCACPFEGVDFGVAPLYLSRSCCVELYFVAILSFSIVASRCLFREARYAWVEEVR